MMVASLDFMLPANSWVIAITGQGIEVLFQRVGQEIARPPGPSASLVEAPADW
jgi:hypothetical protein